MPDKFNSFEFLHYYPVNTFAKVTFEEEGFSIALFGFELEALDYLLKPFSFERFLKAVNRSTTKLSKSEKTELKKYLFIKSDKKLYKVAVEDVLYLQAYGDYVKVFTKQQTLLAKERLSNIEKSLPNELFQRVHRSYIIALSAVQFIEGNQVQIGPIKLPIATTYKEELMLRLKSH